MKTPKFWKNKNIISFLLYPLSILYYIFYKIRYLLNPNPYKSKIPIICIGNIIAGGSGKTPTAIEIFKTFEENNKKCCFLTKGYGGKFKGIIKVNKNSNNKIVGDESLILCEYGDVFISKNRVNGLKYINNNFDYDYIIMDDGLQNPTFVKDKIILVINGEFGFGNNFIIPAGPLREKFKNVIKKINLVIINGQDKHNVANLCEKYNILYTNSKIKAIIKNEYLNNEYIAFCGLGLPEKFKNTLTENKIKIIDFVAFSDHHQYLDEDIEKLKTKYNNKLITTKKDWVKLSNKYKNNIDYLDIYLEINKEIIKKI